MGNESPLHLSTNLHFNFQIKVPKRKSRSEMGLLNTLQEYSDAPIPALVVHVSSVDSFYIHRYEDQERLRDLGLAIGRAQKHRLSSVPSAGTVVLANFQSGDGLWYREAMQWHTKSFRQFVRPFLG